MQLNQSDTLGTKIPYVKHICAYLDICIEIWVYWKFYQFGVWQNCYGMYTKLWAKGLEPGCFDCQPTPGMCHRIRASSIGDQASTWKFAASEFNDRVFCWRPLTKMSLEFQSSKLIQYTSANTSLQDFRTSFRVGRISKNWERLSIILNHHTPCENKHVPLKRDHFSWKIVFEHLPSFLICRFSRSGGGGTSTDSWTLRDSFGLSSNFDTGDATKTDTAAHSAGGQLPAAADGSGWKKIIKKPWFLHWTEVWNLGKKWRLFAQIDAVRPFLWRDSWCWDDPSDSMMLLLLPKRNRVNFAMIPLRYHEIRTLWLNNCTECTLPWCDFVCLGWQHHHGAISTSTRQSLWISWLWQMTHSFERNSNAEPRKEWKVGCILLLLLMEEILHHLIGSLSH